MRTATNSKSEGLPSPIGRTDTRRLAAGLAAIFANALVGTTALAQSIQSEIQDQEQPGSEVRVPFGRILEPGPEPAPSPEQLGAPLAPFDGSLRPLLPPAEANPGIPNGEDDGANIDAPDDPDAPPDAGAADDTSGPDDDPVPNE
jgi:hypothetical protein